LAVRVPVWLSEYGAAGYLADEELFVLLRGPRGGVAARAFQAPTFVGIAELGERGVALVAERRFDALAPRSGRRALPFELADPRIEKCNHFMVRMLLPSSLRLSHHRAQTQ
jgi:hypothetical protein